MGASTLASPGHSDAAHRPDDRDGDATRRDRMQSARRIRRWLRADDRRRGARGRRSERGKGDGHRDHVRGGYAWSDRGRVMTVPRGDARALTRALVAIDSQNPSLVQGGAGEAGVARVLADVLREWGFRVE